MTPILHLRSSGAYAWEKVLKYKGMFGLLPKAPRLRLACCRRCGAQIDRRRCGVKIVWHVDETAPKKMWPTNFSCSPNACLRCYGAPKVRLWRLRQRTKHALSELLTFPDQLKLLGWIRWCMQLNSMTKDMQVGDLQFHLIGGWLLDWLLGPCLFSVADCRLHLVGCYNLQAETNRIVTIHRPDCHSPTICFLSTISNDLQHAKLKQTGP